MEPAGIKAPIPNTSFRRRDGYAEAQEVVGTCTCPSQIAPDERNHDVHVWQLTADLQHHDGLHALHESYQGSSGHQPGIFPVRVRGNSKEIVYRQGGVRVDAAGRARVGSVEGQFDGTVTVCSLE